jgi:hypothetical protein
MTESDLKKSLDKLFNEVVVGKAYLNIARGLGERLTADKALAMTAGTFFTLTLSALMVQSQLCAARLFDERGDSLSIHEMLRKAETHVASFKDATPEEALLSINDARQKLDAQAELLRRLKTRRDKVIAHLDLRASLSPGVIAENIKLTYRELEQLFITAGDILNGVSGMYQGATTMLEPLDLRDYDNALDLIARGKCDQIAQYEKEFGPWPHPEHRPKSCS